MAWPMLEVEEAAHTEIHARPECQPAGPISRECVDLKIVAAFPIANSGCAITFEYTVCAYSPGVMLKEGALGAR